ncbi:Gfo/Idh/MocA family oxidoreductase [bacterium]|nr:Gfo/Idh/MocA family oxidoreductase [bacterium]
MNRRNFVKYIAAGSLATGAAPLLWGNQKQWRGANDRIRVAVIGIHGMGQNHILEYSKLENVEVAALCDVDENLFEERIKKLFTDRGLKRPQTYGDIRKLLEDKTIDAVSVVTPNHWHALAAIWAMQAGKHVSVEKPCCYNIFEGKKLVEAAQKYKMVCQDGAEQRSNPCARTAVEFLRKGGIGEVYMAKGMCYKWRDTIGKYPDGPVEPYTKEYLGKVHYDLWIGPAPERPFNRNRFHYNWHWNWEYGNGDIGNQGPHEMDIARWGLGVTLPTKVTSMGGHFMFDDAQNTPNAIVALFEFPSQEGGGDKKKMLQFEVRHWNTNDEGDIRKQANQNKDNTQGYMMSDVNVIGNIFYGSEGYMVKTVDRWWTFMGKKQEPGPSGGGIGNHYQNFIDAVRANDPGILTAPIIEGYHTCSLVHLANTSYRLGRSLVYDPVNERYVGDKEADAMMSRDYRKPFYVPDKV